MGYVFATGGCIGCGNVFTFNPVHVPSIRVNGVREPVCQSCVNKINQLRTEKGLEPFTIMSDAYEPTDERNLPND